MKQTVDAGEPVVSARRRLIRGAFATPAALTLHCGGAFAASSSARCLANQLAYPEFPTASGLTDTWLRVQLWTLGVDATLSTWISGADLWALLSNGMRNKAKYTLPYLGEFSWQCFTAAESSGFTSGQKLDVAPQLSGYSLAHNGSYVAVRVDDKGSIIGVVDIDGTTGSAVARSCWSSFSGVKV